MTTLSVNMADLPKISKTPILTYCRQLLKKGYPKDMGLEFFRENAKTPDVIVLNLGRAALNTVQEDRQVGPRFVKYIEKVHPYAEKDSDPTCHTKEGLSTRHKRRVS